MLVNINVLAEGEATLKYIKINGKECTCSGYDCAIEVDSNSAIVTFELTDSKATTDRNSGFSVDLSSLVTNIKIVVNNTLNEEKVENTYNITITKHEKSSDYTLKKLSVNKKDIDLLEDVYVYSYQAEYDEELVVISATPTDSKAKVLTEKEYEFPLDRSSLALDFDVKAENGDIKTYRIVVSRGVKPDTTLKTLKVDHGKIDFDKDKLEYAFSVDYSINELTIEAVANNDKANVKIEKDTLVVGENTIKIIVTNEKATSEYVLLVTREPNMDKSLANLSKLEISEYPKFNFEENVLDYTLKFHEIPKSLTIKAKSKDPESKIEIIDNEDLKDGSIIKIKNTLNETGIVREYLLEIQESKSISDNKTFILISMIMIIIVIIVMVILEIKEHKIMRHKKLTRIKELKIKKEKNKKEKKNKNTKKEEDIEII